MSLHPESERQLHRLGEDNVDQFFWLGTYRSVPFAVTNIRKTKDIIPSLIDRGYVYLGIPEVKDFLAELSQGVNHAMRIGPDQRSIFDYVIHPEIEKTAELQARLRKDYPLYVVQYFTRPCDHVAGFHMRMMLEAYLAMCEKRVIDYSAIHRSLNLRHSMMNLQRSLHNLTARTIPSPSVETIRMKPLTESYVFTEVVVDNEFLSDKSPTQGDWIQPEVSVSIASTQRREIDSLKTIDVTSLKDPLSVLFSPGEIGELNIDLNFDAIIRNIEKYIPDHRFHYCALRAFEINAENEDLLNQKTLRGLLANEKNNADEYMKYLHVLVISSKEEKKDEQIQDSVDCTEVDRRAERVHVLAQKLYTISELNLTKIDATRLIEELLPLLGYRITGVLYE